MSRMSTSRRLSVPVSMSKRILPRAFWGPGKSMRKAIVGAMSMARMPATTAPSLIPGPAAMNVARMFTLSARSTRFGIYPCWPQSHDHVAAPVRMQRVRPVDVAQILLEEDLVHHFGVRVRRVGEGLERLNRRGPYHLVRDSGG